MKLLFMFALCAGLALGQTRSAESIKQRVRSCEKREWPVSDPVCHGYALSMAHDYYLEHPDLYEAEQKTAPISTFTIQGGIENSNQTVLDFKDQRPLKCGKYQHVEHWSGRCGPQPNQCDPDSTICAAAAICTSVPPDHCADDLHVVTESEWQDLKEHVRTLERFICVNGATGILTKCKAKP